MIYLGLISGIGLLLCLACFLGAYELATLHLNQERSKLAKLFKLFVYFIAASVLIGALAPETTDKFSQTMRYEGNLDSYIAIASIILAIAACAFAFVRGTNRHNSKMSEE